MTATTTPLAVAAIPDIDVDWAAVTIAAEDLEREARLVRGFLADAAADWRGLHAAYRHPETEQQVHAALDDLAPPADAWVTAARTARTTLDDFAEQGRELTRQSRALEAELPRVRSAADDATDQSRTDDERATDRATVTGFNEQATDLAARWEELKQRTADALSGIAGGEEDLLPDGAGAGAPGALPAAGFAAVTTSWDTRLGVKPTAASLYGQVQGLPRDELMDWSLANPELAQVLAHQQLPTGGAELFAPAGSGERVLGAAASSHPDDPFARIDAVRAAWLSLPPGEQDRMLLTYAGALGALNGIPMAARVKANSINVVAYRQDVREKAPVLVAGSWTGDPARLRRTSLEAQDRESVATGLDYAVNNRTPLVMVSADGDGRVVAMKGTFTQATNKVATYVPGTTSDLGKLNTRLEDLDAIDGTPGPDRVSFYWQGADMPNQVISDNLTPRFDDEGAPLLAAFDHAIDLESNPGTRSTYVAHSAGAPLLGTAEKHGLTATNIVYVAPAGPGHGVASPADTASPNAHRYWLQTRDDPIAMAQGAAGDQHGPGFLAGAEPYSMRPQRLETGFADDMDPRSLLHGHDEYFQQSSTSARVIQGVIEGGKVVKYVPDEHTASGYESPIQTRPWDFTDGRLEWVPVDSLER
ncbi:alpha/beta hydrolase [Tersicoccus sp. MR15.9]|uniref:alpha/beta hydrolase n=1 Tax=Tersicoccus mangrovi TaxID=3121635 RepID=UPI002FE5AB1B